MKTLLMQESIWAGLCAGVITHAFPWYLPCPIHYKPKTRWQEQIDIKDHWIPVTPDYLSEEPVKASNAAHAYDPFRRPPYFSLDSRFWETCLYEQQNFLQEYVHPLMSHADAKTRR